jgi:hypothetical protein
MSLSRLSRCSRDLNDLLARRLYRHITLEDETGVGRFMTSIGAAHQWVEEREKTKVRYALRPPRFNSTLTSEPHVMPTEHVETITINYIPSMYLRENLAKFADNLSKPFIFPNVDKIGISQEALLQLAGKEPPTWKRARETTVSRKMIPPELARLANPMELCIVTPYNHIRVKWGFDNVAFCLQTLVETWSRLQLVTVHGNSDLFKTIGKLRFHSPLVILRVFFTLRRTFEGENESRRSLIDGYRVGALITGRFPSQYNYNYSAYAHAAINDLARSETAKTDLSHLYKPAKYEVHWRDFSASQMATIESEVLRLVNRYVYGDWKREAEFITDGGPRKEFVKFQADSGAVCGLCKGR